MAVCSHLGLHLRMCMSCGEVGCCDSSPNRHTIRHAREASHPIARSAEAGEDWGWFFVDEVGFVVEVTGAASAGVGGDLRS
jgi:ubiquitin-hydrolase Zn-finger-containing protein